MSRFDYISVRENDGIDICHDTFGLDAVQTMDPVFICDKSEYYRLIKTSKVETDKPYILTPTVEKRNALLELSNSMGLDIKLVLDAQSDFEKTVIL